MSSTIETEPPKEKVKRTLENRKTHNSGSAECIVNMVIVLKVGHQNSDGIFHRTRKHNPKIHEEIPKEKKMLTKYNIITRPKIIISIVKR